MKIQEAITEADSLKPNMYDNAQKIRWLSRLDGRIYEQIILTHKRNDSEEEITFTPYGDGDGEKELLVGEPYDEMYVHWLCAQIDYANREFDGFNTCNAMFDAVFGAFRNAYNQSHMPIGRGKIYY